jgi:pimeloyl-ACP methyl ester carboxylesterase
MSRGDLLVVDGVTLELQSWPGAASRLPVLLLHEGLGSVSLWRDFPERLAAATGREVIAWSRRGHGLSDPVPSARDPDYMHREADGLPALLDALAIRRAHFFGHSDGSSIALIAAACFPAAVASLILEAPHVYVEELTIDSIAGIRDAFETTDLPSKMARHHANADHIFRRWNDIWLDPRFLNWNIESLLPSITAPALLIQGRDDAYGTMDQLDRIGAVLPDIARLELDSCGHSPHRDRPRAVLDAALAFLEGRE